LIGVSDTGVGIDSGHQARLFRPFEQADSSTTRRYGGTGLGLVICRQLTQLMGGDIELASRIDEGTTVTLRLPLRSAEYRTLELNWRGLCLAGLDENQYAGLPEQMQALSCPVTVCSLEEGLTESTGDTVIVPLAAVRDGRVALPDNDRKRFFALYMPDESPSLSDAIRPRMALLAWPIRMRHLLARPDAPAIVPPTLPRQRLHDVAVLAAEDNEVNRVILADVLRKEGARVRFAHNGLEALEILSEAGGDGFDVVLMDIQMPVMDGYLATRYIKERYPDLPVIGLTAHALRSERERCLAAGMCEHVSKPIDVDQLVAVVSSHCRIGPAPPVSQAYAATADSDGGLRMSDAVIDWLSLTQRYDGRRDFIDKLLSIFAAESREKLRQLEETRTRHDYKALAELAHGLKSAAGNIDAGFLFEQAKTTEQMARQHEEAVWTEAQRLCESLSNVLAEMEKHLSSGNSLERK
ncbi:MAG: response regulator, partial [Gammaproteobacteria bacterium]